MTLEVVSMQSPHLTQPLLALSMSYIAMCMCIIHFSSTSHREHVLQGYEPVQTDNAGKMEEPDSFTNNAAYLSSVEATGGSQVHLLSDGSYELMRTPHPTRDTDDQQPQRTGQRYVTADASRPDTIP